jgi:hypothetical protein
MFVQGGALPVPELLISSGHVRALIGIVLALCCAVLWVITQPGEAGHVIPPSVRTVATV